MLHIKIKKLLIGSFLCGNIYLAILAILKGYSSARDFQTQESRQGFKEHFAVSQFYDKLHFDLLPSRETKKRLE